jgi:acyl carrier protein
MPEPADDHETLEFLREAIRDITDAPVEEVGPDARLAALGNWSSLAALRLLTTIEDSLGVWLDLREYLAVETVGELDTALRDARQTNDESS